MSRDSRPDIPSGLRDRLREEGEEHADLETVWHLLDDADLDPSDTLDLDEEWAMLCQRRPEVQGHATAPSSSVSGNGRMAERDVRQDRRPVRARRSRTWGRWVGAFAVALLVVLGAAWIWRQPVTVTAPPGEQRTTTLPDGSSVELNSGTTIAYRRHFQAWPFVEAERRAVHLDGEAFFTVETGDRSFVVETDEALVEVEGTRFNVRARAAVDSTTEVTVAEGRVRVSPQARPERAVVLEGRGQRSRVYDQQATAPQQAELDPVLVWRRDGFAVSGEPLVQVVHELEQRYDTSIQIHESVGRSRASLSLYYPERRALTTVLRDLCTALDLNYRPTSQGYEIFSGPDG